MPRERGAIHLTQENYRVNSIWHDRERERGAGSAVPCLDAVSSSWLGFIVQEEEEEEGSPAPESRVQHRQTHSGTEPAPRRRERDGDREREREGRERESE